MFRTLAGGTPAARAGGTGSGAVFICLAWDEGGCFHQAPFEHWWRLRFGWLRPCHRSWAICGSCADLSKGVRADLCARFQCQEELVEVTRFSPHARIVVVFPTFHRRGSAASRSRSWGTSTTDRGEKVEVIVLVRVAEEQTLAVPMPQVMDIVEVIQLAKQNAAWCHGSWKNMEVCSWHARLHLFLSPR